MVTSSSAPPSLMNMHIPSCAVTGYRTITGYRLASTVFVRIQVQCRLGLIGWDSIVQFYPVKGMIRRLGVGDETTSTYSQTLNG